MDGRARKTPYIAEHRRRVFLARLCECGQPTKAARTAGVDVSRLYKERKRNPDFAKEWEEAIDVAMYGAESEVYRRAVDGVEQPVFQGGKLVGTFRKHSDVLLMFLLKAHNPGKYRDTYRGTDGGDVSLDAWAKDVE